MLHYIDSSHFSFVSATAAQKKWKGLRASYTRELLKKKSEKNGSGASGRKQYIYFENLRFLETVTKPTTSSMDDKDENQHTDDDYDDMDVGTSKRKNLNPIPKISKKKGTDDDLLDVLKAKILKNNKRQAEERNEDRMFLLSLVSELQKVPADRKLQVKASILNVISQAQAIQQPLQPHFATRLGYNPTFLTQTASENAFQDRDITYWQMQPSTSARGNDIMKCTASTPSPTSSSNSDIIHF